MEQKEANDQLQDILRRRQEELEKREAYVKEQEAQHAEKLSNLPESYKNAVEDEALEHREYPKEEDKAKKDVESAMSYRSLVHGVRLAATMLIRMRIKKGYRYSYKQHTISEGDLLLKELTQKSNINFLHDFDRMATNVPNLSIQALLTEGVTSSVRYRGVDVTSSLSIYNYLKSAPLNLI
eukprot:snap_masked-scaffold_45-processed-gene-0.56-mRNA-1 protein AED:1.00 eAED:1.00 QI:0/0/0/0/1/1/2/0/180